MVWEIEMTGTQVEHKTQLQSLKVAVVYFITCHSFGSKNWKDMKRDGEGKD